MKAATILIEKEGCSKEVPLSTLESITGAKYAPYLEFSHLSILKKILSRKRPTKLSSSRLWLTAYFQHDVLKNQLPPVSIRWASDPMGWGIFAEKEFSAMEFITEYTGKVRLRGANDSKNAYCFEYLLEPDLDTPYLIDAQNQGGISRYVNHHPKPNLLSAFILVDRVPHIILYTAKRIAKGEQLFYDYGPDYWKKRTSPIVSS